MDGSLLDKMYGKQYDLPVFDNSLVRVESAGNLIRVGIKKDGAPFSWWEPEHPFVVEDRELPQQGRWQFKVQTPDPNTTMAVFSDSEETHMLNLVCTNPNVSPKPIEVHWVSRKNRS